MSKRIFAVLICLLLSLTLLTPVYATEAEETDAAEPEVVVKTLSIFNAEDFLEFAENCRVDTYSQNLEVTLKSDLDLSGTDFDGIPIFCGTFRGNAHTVSGVSITSDGSYQGFFRYVTSGATVRDLTVIGQISPEGSRAYVGTIAGSNAGTIDHCKFRGSVSGGDYVGGIAGINTVTGVINWCDVEGEIYGDHFVGGIAGENHGVIRKSINWAMINTTPKQNTVNISDITLDTLTNSESANTVTDIGGVAGLSSGVIRNCDNRGDVGYRLMGYNIGGIAGTQSGYITGCENFGTVHGRKEVGGIVGQMEPITQIEYTQDTIQILKEQLNSMSGLVSRVSGNAQSNASQITGQIGVLRDQVQTAKDAIEALYPSGNGSSFPDADAFLAAQNTLSRTLESMPSTMGSIATAAQSTISGLSRDLSALSGHIGAMGQTLNNASENLGGTITDISDLDTPDLLTGKVENCVNIADVFGDLNIGGIAGAMAMENDLDIYEDIQQHGDMSLNFDSEVRAVVLNCNNSGIVSGNKQSIGGLVGWQSLGLLKDSTNTGNVDAPKADHVGGACGTSTGYVRAVATNCVISGDAYVGGIAGSGTIISDSLAQVKLLNVREKVGNILGWQDEALTDVENPICGNYYLKLEDDCGAVDGISYAGQAEPMELQEFLAISDLPETFQKVKVRFIFEEGNTKEISVPIGEALEMELIPEIPAKDGHSAIWDGLQETDLSKLYFDLRFEAVYDSHSTAIACEEISDDGRPMLLLEGVFTANAEVKLQPIEDAPGLEEKETILKTWKIKSNEQGTNARLILADVEDVENLKLYIRNAGGQWQETAFQKEGSYLVFAMTDLEADVAVVQIASNSTVWFVGAAAAIAVVLVAVILIAVEKRRKGNQKKTKTI